MTLVVCLDYSMKDILGFIGAIAFFGIVAYGYIMNLVQLFQNNYSDGMVVLKVIGGLVPPIGVIMGYIG